MLLALLVAACSAEQAGATFRTACRHNPGSCTDRDAIPATRSQGL
jgi:hypothetical protein